MNRYHRKNRCHVKNLLFDTVGINTVISAHIIAYALTPYDGKIPSVVLVHNNTIDNINVFIIFITPSS